MKVHLMFAERDFDLGRELPSQAGDLARDLDLKTLIDAMSGGVRALAVVAEHAVLADPLSRDEIAYRQEVLADALAHPEVIREIFTLASETVAREKKIYRPWSPSARGSLRRSIEVMEMFLDSFHRLRRLATDQLVLASSRGMTNLASMIEAELSEEYLRSVERQLSILQLKDGVFLSARLGDGNRGVSYILHPPGKTRVALRQRVGLAPRRSFRFEVAPRDEAGARALSDLADRGITPVARALALSADHIASFFSQLAVEAGFYLSCVNLADALMTRGQPIAMATLAPWQERRFCCTDLYDPCLVLGSTAEVFGNTVDADGRGLVMVTGANSGGKSTFLRSVGLAQLMAEAGVFVCASSLRLSSSTGLFSHFLREEDHKIESGKLDEELQRMSAIVDRLKPGSVVAFNESFAATNEREGSEIARRIVDSLLEHGVRVFFVTHLFTLANGLYQSRGGESLFLRAPSKRAGSPRFLLAEGAPLATSFGRELYDRLGGFSRLSEDRSRERL